MFKNKIYLILTICLFICLVLFVSRKVTQATFDQQIIYSSSPKFVLESFWKNSFSGNAERVFQLSKLPPDDMLQDCIGKQSEDKKLDSDIPQLTNNRLEEIDKINTEMEPTSESDISFSSKSVDSSITNLARYIYTTKLDFSRVKIITERSFQNEAILEIQISDLNGKFNYSSQKMLFFNRDGNDWVIIASVNKGSDENLVWNNLRFATPRFSCKEEKTNK